MKAYPLACLGMAWLALGLGCIDVSTIPAPEGGPPALQWIEQTWPQPSARSGHAMATLGDKVVLFGGADDSATWEWDGGTWTEMNGEQGIPPSAGSGGAARGDKVAMATLGDKVVLFDGSHSDSVEHIATDSGVFPISTWEWNGTTWTPKGPPTSPPPRSGHAMATLGNEVILFGGEGADGRPLDDTWKWDGTTWTKLTPIGGPPARSNHAMATLGDRVVLFGGLDASGQALADTWEWNGSVWTQKNPNPQSASPGAPGAPASPCGQGGSPRENAQPVSPVSPGARSGHAMATLGDNVILLGGDVVPGSSGDYSGRMWQWDGTTWTPLPQSGGPTAGRSNFAVASLNGTLLLFGGWSTDVDEGPGFAAGDTWEWNGDFWLPRAVSPSSGNGALAELGGKAVALSNDLTWEWDGAMWTALHPSPSPEARFYKHAMATLGDKIVFFGGNDDCVAPIGDTWEWDGARWGKRDSSTSPAARMDYAMATLGDKVVLFGGWRSGSPLGDTWEWDGTAWTERKPKVSPPARVGHAMATLGDKVVLFGGEDASREALGDTWEWDGATWTQLSSPSAPRARTGHAMATMNESVVLFGGRNGDTFLDDTWALIRGTWTQPPLLTTHPAPLWGLAMATVGGEVVLLGDGETWVLDAPAPPVCGNAVLESDEQCDDGNDDETDECTNSCRLARCGDGILQPGFGEECDDGNADETDGCPTDCLYRCGDGILQPGSGEECDDGNADETDGCGTDCLYRGAGSSLPPLPPPAGSGASGGAGGAGGAPPLAGRSG